MQLKLDELIRATDGAHIVLLDLEELSEDGLENIRKEYEKLAQQARAQIKNGKSDTGVTAIDIKAICSEQKNL